MPIKLSVAPQQFLDEEGKPIAGRVTFYKHDSNDLATIYTMEDNSFVLAPNPQLLNAMGALQDTVFFDADILDMKVERYIGQPDAMDMLSPDFAFYAQFEVGIDYKALMEQAETVSNIAELKQTDPDEFKAVQVQDVPWRVYVWDEYATNAPDDGIVVQSDVTSDGRWLLLWDDEMLPSSIYGVQDGNYANITSLLSYPDVAGSIGLHTPQIVRFVPGPYGTTTWVSTTKTLAFGNNTRFTGGGFTCRSARQLSSIDSYFADLRFTDPNAEAHSAWFRTVGGFWRSGAHRLVMDRTNHFDETVLDSTVLVQKAVIEGVERMGAFTTQSNYLTLERCVILGNRLFSPKDDYIRFVGMEVDDTFFLAYAASQWDLGKISAGHHIECITLGASNTYPLSKFRSADVWLKFYDTDQANAPTPSTTVDLQNREVSEYAYSRFDDIRNMVVKGNLTLPANAAARLTNVHVEGYLRGGNVLALDRCTAVLDETDNLVNLSATDSAVASRSAITHPISITCFRCRYAVHVDNAADNETDVGSIVLSDSTVMEQNVKFRTKKLYLYNCTLTNPDVVIYPYKDGSTYRIDGAVENCVIAGSRDLRYTKNHAGVGGLEEVNCHHVVFNYRWLNNSFQGTMPKGVWIDLWAVNSSHQFFVALSGNNVAYRGNYGNCPADKLRENAVRTTLPAQYRFFNDGLWTYTDWYVAGANPALRAFVDPDSRLAGGAFTRFAEMHYSYAFPFDALMQMDVAPDLMEDPAGYGDYCRVCYVKLSPVSSQQVGII